MRRSLALAISIPLVLTSVALAQPVETPTCLGKEATIVAGDKELVHGTSGADVIVASDRQDSRAYGLGGNDLICGGTDSNFIYGGRGNDRIVDFHLTRIEGQTLSGGPGHDRISGQASRVTGGRGNDYLRTFDAHSSGGRGDDEMIASSIGVLEPGPGSDRMRIVGTSLVGLEYGDESGPVHVDLVKGFAQTPTGRDVIAGTTPTSVYGTGFDDVIRLGDYQAGEGDGRQGDDVVMGGPGDNTLYGGAGDDLLIGRGGKDSLDGDYSGNRRPKPARGDDILRGGAGDDWLRPGPGRDEVAGRGGHDTVAYGGDVPLRIDLTAGTAVGWGADSLSSIEGAIGSTSADTLIGTNGPNTFDPAGAKEGVDEVLGNGGDDRVSGGEGDLLFDGGDGSDLISYRLLSQTIDADLPADEVRYGNARDEIANVENVAGTRGDDRLIGDEDDNLLLGYGGDDEIDGGQGNDRLSGDCDLLAEEAPPANSCAGNDRIVGSDGDDVLYGGEAADVLDGGPGTDSANGGNGSDACINNESKEECET